MRCQRCGKEERVIFLLPVQDEEGREIYLCESCVRELIHPLLILMQSMSIPTPVKSIRVPPRSIAPVFPWQKPAPPDPKLRIAVLKERLEALIHDEKYEEARKLSDLIKTLEQSTAQNHPMNHGTAQNSN